MNNLNIHYSCYAGNSENISWLANRKALDADAECVTEPQVNFINGSHSQRRRRCESLII